MKWLLKLRKRKTLERDLQEELSFHREMRARDEDAPPFGNVTRIRETTRELWTLGAVEVFLQDMRYALRGMLTHPAFTITAVLLLALGIGANTAMFSLVKHVILDPLPYPDSDQLVRVWSMKKQERMPFSATALDYQDFATRNTGFDGIAAYTGRGMTLTGEGEPDLFIGVTVSTNFFRVLGVMPAMGRDFRNEEQEQGRHRVLVLSHGLWERKFQRDPNVVGKTTRIDGEPWEIIGVMPAGFSYPDASYEAWAPIPFIGGDRNWINRNTHYLRLTARRKLTTSLAAAAKELEMISAQLEQQYPDTNQNIGSLIRPLKETVIEDSTSLILLLDGAVILLLLIACSNLASLLIARANARAQEFAMRTALGASGLRLAAQIITETLALSTIGGTAGLLIAALLITLLKQFAPPSLSRISEVALDPTSMLFCGGLVLLTALLTGLAPAVRVARVIQSARGTTHGIRQRTRAILVVTQVALAVVLLCAAALVLQSFRALSSIDTGFDTRNVVSMNFVLDTNRYPKDDQILRFTRDLDERLSLAPGVEAAGFTTSLPLTGQGWGNPISVEGQLPVPGKQTDVARLQGVSPRYFATLRTPLREGRHLLPTDSAGAPLVVLVDETFARQHMRDSSALGKRVKIGDANSTTPWRTIVGVVATTRQVSLEGNPEPHIYLPYNQLADLAGLAGRGVYVVARSTADSAGTVKGVLAELDKYLPVREVSRLQDRVDAALAPRRFSATLMTGFAVTALLLAAIGLYGLVAFAVTARTREIGVRMALGATTTMIRRMILTDGLRLTALGIALGVTIALAFAGAIERMLFGVHARDAATLVAVSALLGIVAVIASALPARRATRIDPLAALRNE